MYLENVKKNQMWLLFQKKTLLIIVKSSTSYRILTDKNKVQYNYKKKIEVSIWLCFEEAMAGTSQVVQRYYKRYIKFLRILFAMDAITFT